MVENAIRWAKDAGIAVVNADLMAFLEGETPESLVDSMQKLARIMPDIINLYRYMPVREDGQDGGMYPG